MNYYQKNCEGILHTIRQGDTLYRLSRMYGVTVNDIMEANPAVNVYNLTIGSTLCIPIDMPLPCCPCQNGPHAPGIMPRDEEVPENMTGMGVSPSEQEALEQMLTAPKETAETSAHDQGAEAEPVWRPGMAAMMPYRVRRGDSLNSILRRFNMDFDTFARLNPQTMPIPLRAGETVFVKRGRPQPR